MGNITDRTVVEGLAGDANEATRLLNHATINPADWADPAAVHAVLGALSQLTGRLEQMFRQIEAAVMSLATSGELASTGDLDADVRTIIGHLGGANTAALHERISVAHQTASRLHHRR